MKGVVLCGGYSTRMGSDKGLLQYGSSTWAALAISKLARSIKHIILSVNKGQYNSYLEKFHGQAAIVKDDEALDVYGPLKGILSVHLQYPGSDLLVLACDMLLIKNEVLEQLIEISSKGAEEAFVFHNGEQIQPLCAVYTASSLAKIYQFYKQGQLQKHSLHYILKSLKTCYLPFDKKWTIYFSNFNSPDDLSTL